MQNFQNRNFIWNWVLRKLTRGSVFKSKIQVSQGHLTSWIGHFGWQTLYTLTSIPIPIFSRLFPLHVLWLWQGLNLFDNLELLKFVIISIFSWPLLLIQGWYYKEKLEASHLFYLVDYNSYRLAWQEDWEQEKQQQGKPFHSRYSLHEWHLDFFE